ncbi:50S ribosomal protein L6 [Candidatus Woesearchaeota archaeon]|nr:50S ribosomal protein L6 [Candidatus Woesearchaeota archaeon]
MKEKIIEEFIEIPEGVEINTDNSNITVKGPNGEVKRTLHDPKIKIKIEDKKVKIYSNETTKREKRKIGTFKAHIKNMIKGTTESHKYVLKICSGHFPMNVALNNNEFVVKNFIGEKVPRVLKIKENVVVNIEDEIITVTGIDKELVAQTSADIETLTKRVGFDRRIFQDGIFITEKDGKIIS